MLRFAMMVRSGCLLFLLISFALSTKAQDLDPTRTGGEVVTLAEAIRHALDVRTDLQRAEIGIRAQAAAVEVAKTENRWPTLNAGVSPLQSYGLTFDQTTGQLVTQGASSLDLGVDARWTIYDGGRRGASVQRAQLEHEAAEESILRTQQQVAINVAERFLQVILDRELVAVQERALADAERQLEFIESLVEGGVRPRADIAAQRAVVAERRGALIDARTAAARDVALLVEATSLDPLTEYDFTGPSLTELDATGLLDPTLPPLDSLIATARTRRSDLAAQAVRSEAAEASVGVARALSRPSLSVFGNVGTRYSSLQQRLQNPNDPGVELPVTLPDGTPVLVGGAPFTIPQQNQELERTPFFNQLGDNRSGSFGLTLSIPLFDGLQRRAQVQQARIQAEDARLELEGVEKKVAADVQLSLIETEAAADRYNIALERIQAAEAATQFEEDRYELGAGTTYSLSDARSRLADAESARAQAAYQLVFQATLLRFATGEFSVDHLPTWAD